MSAALSAIQGNPATEAPTSAPPPAGGSQAPVAGSDEIKQAVAARSDTFGDIANTMDSLALTVGDSRISVWVGLVGLMVMAVVLALGYFGSRIASRAIGRVSRLDLSRRLLLEKFVAMLVWAVAVMVGIDVLGIDLTALAVFSGAFGLAVGFGLQKTFGNLIAGMILLLDRSIKPGDVIAIADQAGNYTFGQIRRIGIRAVSLTTRDQKEYLIPNENLMINQVENWSYSSRNVRMQVPVGVSYSADMARAEELMLQAARACKRILEVPPPTVWMDSFGDNSVNFVIHCWISDPEEGLGNVRSEVLKNLWWLFKENGIEIPFPQRDINLRENAAFRDLIEALHKPSHAEAVKSTNQDKT